MSAGRAVLRRDGFSGRGATGAGPANRRSKSTVERRRGTPSFVDLRPPGHLRTVSVTSTRTTSLLIRSVAAVNCLD